MDTQLIVPATTKAAHGVNTTAARLIAKGRAILVEVGRGHALRAMAMDLARTCEASTVVTWDGTSTSRLSAAARLAIGRADWPGGAARLLDVDPRTVFRAVERLNASPAPGDAAVWLVVLRMLNRGAAALGLA